MKHNLSFDELSSNWVQDVKNAIPNGSRVVVVCSHGGLKRGILESIHNAIVLSDIVIEIFAPETPDLTFLREIFDPVAKLQVDYIVSVGGGSVLDTAKAIKLFFSVKDWADFQRQAENGVSIKPNGCQIVAVPTTAGSGSEVTPFATLWDRGKSKKLSIDAPWLLPNTPIVDPVLLATLCGDKLLFPALDAISHAVESLWSKKKTPESREYALSALSFSENAIESFKNGSPDLNQFALASTNAGKAIAISRTALAHSISYPLTLSYGVPHGLACSFTLGEIFLRVTECGELEEEEFHQIESILSILRPLDIGSRIRDYCSIDEVLELIPQMSSAGRSNNVAWRAIDFDLFAILHGSITN
jgi:alcohol dehydrogenase class IV